MPAKQKAHSNPTSTNARKAKSSKKEAATQSLPKRTLAKKTAVRQTLIKQQTPVKQQTPAKQHTPLKQHTPVKQQTPVKQTSAPVKRVQPDRPKESPAEQYGTTPPSNQPVGRSANVWTPVTSRSFYSNVNSLSGKLNDRQSVQAPQNYRLEESKDHWKSGDYTLSYEEELHLADHFAFLAHVTEGHEFVSAVTIEESRDPPSFTVRLASNRTPKPHVKEGLERILQIVRDHALEGRNRDRYKSRLFDEVVMFSQKRIYARLRCSQWEVPYHLQGTKPPNLATQIEKHLLNPGAGSLKLALADLIESLKIIDQEPFEERSRLLKTVIHKSYAISHQGGCKSLESSLQAKGFSTAVCQSREVLEIDKLSKYIELCDDLLRLSRQPSTRTLCQRLTFEALEAYPRSQPLGSLSKCYVHGEVQLVLFHERHSNHTPPRAIGSSKSACFLCDLFIKRHGCFGISHSHMKLYPKWTIPEASWMSTKQVELLRRTIQAMTVDIETLANASFYHHNAVIESRAHILQMVQCSETASSAVSPAISEIQPGHVTGTLMSKIDSVASAASSTLNCMSSRLYYFQDLPIALKILPSTISCTLLVGKVDYIFDLQEIEHGQLLVSECKEDDMILDDLRVNVSSLPFSVKYLRNQDAGRNFTFRVHDAKKYELRVSMIWNPQST